MAYKSLADRPDKQIQKKELRMEMAKLDMDDVLCPGLWLFHTELPGDFNKRLKEKKTNMKNPCAVFTSVSRLKFPT